MDNSSELLEQSILQDGTSKNVFTNTFSGSQVHGSFKLDVPLAGLRSIVQYKRNVLSNPSVWALLCANLVTIFFAITESWNLIAILWVYWFQSMTIGLFNFVRILQLKEFSTGNLKIDGQAAKPTQSTKEYTALFFLIHYGFFHLVYCIFLLVGSFSTSYGQNLGFGELKYIFLAALVFFINHLFSYFYNKPKDARKQNIGSLMFYPYIRIIPMHLTIIIGSFFIYALPLFLVLKTFSDAMMHIIEHRVLRKGEEQELQGTQTNTKNGAHPR